MPRSPPSNGLGPASRPSSASELAEEAGNYVYNPTVPLRHWVGAAETLYREGSIYRREGNLAKAYMLLHRFSSLYLNNLAKHPLAKTPEGKKMLKTLQRRLPSVIGQLEEMKPQIDEAHHEWQRMSEAERKEVQDFSSEKSPEYAAHASRDPALAWSNRARAKVLDAGENQELAVDLATKEFRRRKAERYPGAWEQEDEERNGRHQVNRDWTYTREVPTGDDDLQGQMELARRRLDHPDEAEQYTPIRPTQQLTLRSSSYNYPTISKSSPLHYDPSQRERLRDEVAPQPPRPPKEFVSRNESLNRSYAPLVPRKALDQSTMPPSDQEMFSPPPPAVPDKTPNTDQPNKKERYTFKPADYLENGDPLRPVFLPEGLRREFVQLAADKTRQGIEMCGLLCGTIVNNALFVTCLLIPEQKGTPDTCETINESSYFDFMDKEDLVQLGWIHTHPTQTCFMSSRDLHTHAGYQIMTPESIAIVCAPRYEPSWGVFRLTNPPGLNHLLQCSKTDTFHQHDIDSNLLYKDASHPPGHVYISKRLDYYVHDLRPEA